MLLVLGTGLTASAQMGEAQRIVPVIEKKFTLQAPLEKVWEYILEPKNYMKFSGVNQPEFCEYKI